MPLSEAELDALRGFPQQNLTEVPRATSRAVNDELIKRNKGLPYDMTGLAGSVVIVRDDEETLDVAGNAASGLISFGRRPVWQWEPRVITITGNTTISDTNHCGALLKCTNVGAITLTFSSGGGASGISDNFWCNVARMRASGAVQIARGAGITNGHPSDHTRVAAGHIALLWLATAELGFYGGTEA